MTNRFTSTTPAGTRTYGGWRRAWKATERTMDIEDLTPAAWLYAKDPADELRALIESIEQELAVMPHGPHHAEKRAGRERGLELYRRALARIDAAAAERPAATK